MKINELDLKYKDEFYRKSSDKFSFVDRNGRIDFKYLSVEDFKADDWQIRRDGFIISTKEGMETWKKKEDEPISANEYSKSCRLNVFSMDEIVFNSGGMKFELLNEIKEAFEAGEKNKELKIKRLVDELKSIRNGNGYYGLSQESLSHELLKLIN